MTQKQLVELERAIERAGKAGLEVVGQGHRKADGAPVYMVPSATDQNHWHIVVRLGSRLVCDCTAGKYDRICQHRAAVYVELFNQAERRRRLAEEVEAALRQEREERDERRVAFADDDRWALIEAGQW